MTLSSYQQVEKRIKDMAMAKSLMLVFLSMLIGATGQMCLKVGMAQVGRIGAEQVSSPVETLVKIFTRPLILAALPLYAAGFIIWAVVLSRLNLSFAYPLFALNYVIIPVLSWRILGEEISLSQWAGILTICVGVVLVARRR